MDEQNKGVSDSWDETKAAQRTGRTKRRSRDAAASGIADAVGTEPSTDEGTSEIRSDIESTRAEMRETVDAIQDRLRPRTMVARAAESVRDAAVGRMRQLTGGDDDYPRRAADWYSGRGFVARVRDNPVPAAIAAASLAWLAFGKRPSRDYAGPPPYRGDYERNTFGGESFAADEYGYQDESSFEQPVARVRHAMQDAGERARRASSRARSGIGDFAHENTLAAGAIAAGIGALVGLSLPATRRENEVLGATRDAVVERARETARGVAEKVQDTVAGSDNP